MSHERLVHNLRAKRVPTAITKWVSSFLANRSTTVQLGDYISEEKEIEVGIPQGSPISPILYLFYNAPLLESLEGLYLSLSPTGFVDDIALLTYSRSVKRNIYTLQKAYQECLKWATSHGSKFNAEKSELIHFTRRKDSRLGITLEGKTIPPSKEVRLLGVYFNQSLSPSSHLEKIEEKIPGLLGTLGSLSRSTWGLRLELARKLYLGAFRPAIAYGGISWYPIANTRGKKGVIDTLQKWQGKFLRQVLGAYRATANTALEIESFVEPLDLYIQRQVLLDYQTQATSQRATLLHLEQLIGEVARNSIRRQTRPWNPQEPTYIGINRDATTRLALLGEEPRGELKKALEKESLERWKERWSRDEKGRDIHFLAPEPNARVLKLYKDLPKATTSIYIQLRSRKIGLQAFLHRQRVPDITSPRCPYCQEADETVPHFILVCKWWKEQRKVHLGPFISRGIRYFLDTKEGLARAARFLLETERLEQFKATSLDELAQ